MPVSEYWYHMARYGSRASSWIGLQQHVQAAAAADGSRTAGSGGKQINFISSHQKIKLQILVEAEPAVLCITHTRLSLFSCPLVYSHHPAQMPAPLPFPHQRALTIPRKCRPRHPFRSSQAAAAAGTSAAGSRTSAAARRHNRDLRQKYGQ